jgi:hypothetical protein
MEKEETEKSALEVLLDSFLCEETIICRPLELMEKPINSYTDFLGRYNFF